VYVQALLLTSLAQGAWRATYSWYLFVYLGLSPAQLALVVGVQFVLQILLEIPTGAWADREDIGNLMWLSQLGYLGCALVYMATGCLHLDRSSGSPIATFAVTHHTLIAVLTIAGAGFGELLFGVASAFNSGTLDSWLMEKERSAAGEDAEDFARRVDWSKSTKYLCGLATTVMGLGVAFLALKGGTWSLLPWALAALVYLGAMIWVRRQIHRVAGTAVPLATTLRSIAPWTPRSLELVARHSRRAFAYLNESGSVFWIIAQSSFAYVLFWSVQVFWLSFPIAILGWDDSLTRVIPAWALMWAAGEGALSGGGWLAGKLRKSVAHAPNTERTGTQPPPEGRLQLCSWLSLFAIGLALMLASVAAGPRRFLWFGIAYTCCRLAEGAVRKLLDAALERAVLSERATHQSIDSFVKSVMGIVFIAGAGYVFDLDPVNGVILLLVCAVAAIVVFALSPLESPARDSPARSTATASRVGASIAYLLVALSAVFALSQVELAGRAWAWLRRAPPVTISYAGQEALEQPRSAGGVPVEPVTGRIWDLVWRGGKGADWRCEIVGFDLLNLPGTVLNGVEGVLISATPEGQALSFASGEREARVIAATELLRPFRCWPLTLHAPLTVTAAAPLALRFNNKLSFHSGSRSSLVFELFMAAAILTGIFVLGSRRALRVVVDAQQLTPVLNEGGGTARALGETDGLEGIDITRFKEELNVQRIVLGGVRVDEAGAPHGFWAVDFPESGARVALSHQGTERVKRFVLAAFGELETKACGAAPRFSSSMRKWTEKTASAVGERKLDYAAWATAARHLESDAGKRAERVIGFAIAACEDDAAPRYVDPIDRILLHMLADVTCTRYVLFRSRSTSESAGRGTRALGGG